MNLQPLFDHHAGVVSRAQLRASGATDAMIRRAVADREVRRLRRGWFAAPGANDDVSRAVTAGGVASCLTALALAGVWVPYDPRVHTRRTRRHRAKRPAAGLVACDPPERRTTSAPQAVDDVQTALATAAWCQTSEHLTVLLDSALHKGLVTRDDLEALFADAPRRIRRALDSADGLAEAGTETLVRLRLRRRGVALRAQVWIGNRRVDFLVGRSLIIEVDGRAWHDDPEAFERDRERDRALAALGYRVVRLTYRQVIDDWPAVERDLLAIIRRGDHLRAPER